MNGRDENIPEDEAQERKKKEIFNTTQSHYSSNIIKKIYAKKLFCIFYLHRSYHNLL